MNENFFAVLAGNESVAFFAIEPFYLTFHKNVSLLIVSGKVTQKTLVFKTIWDIFSFFGEILYICAKKAIAVSLMVRKLKFMFAALLGFSAACSTVKNVPSRSDPSEPVGPAQSGDPDTCRTSGEVLNTVTVRPRIVVMYGVRPPESVRRNRQPKPEEANTRSGEADSE